MLIGVMFVPLTEESSVHGDMGAGEIDDPEGFVEVDDGGWDWVPVGVTPGVWLIVLKFGNG
jgi:hypothetical protein